MNADLGRKVGLGLLLAALVVVIEIRFAEPTLDGDLYWHLAYAQQMLDRHTLVPDATLYSWTPATYPMIYCAWLSELLLFGIFNALGMAGLFALRYLVIVVVAALFASTIRRAHFAASPATLLVTLLLVVTAYPGSVIKPELFSLLLFHAVLWCYFHAKFDARERRNPRRWFYAVPALTLVWANAHGGHVLLAPLLAATAVGEALNRRFSPRTAFSGRQLVHLLAAWILCAAAVCMTPYGIAYPLQNISELVHWDNSRLDVTWNLAHFPIYAFDPYNLFSQTQLFALLAVAVIVWLLVAARRQGRGGSIDFALVLSLLVYLPLSVQVNRASYLWPALACYALVYLAYLSTSTQHAHDRRGSSSGVWHWNGPIAASIAVLAVAVRVGYDAYAHPHIGSWLGFGVGYQNPVPEAEYLARTNLGSRFYNTFDSGGYLLWRLYPQYKVMVDPRSFPYLGWFRDQYDFTSGNNFDDFLARYPADLAIIDLRKVGNWRRFLRAKDWHLLFYGPTAAIFARRPILSGHPVEDAAELLHLRNADTAFTAFDFAASVGDYAMAWNVLQQLESTLEVQADSHLLERARTYRMAHEALARAELDRASTLFESALGTGVVGDRDLLIRALLRKRRESLDHGDLVAADAIRSELAKLAVPLQSAREF